MKVSKVNHYNQEYNCGIGKAKVNLYTGSLLFEYPLMAIGANNFLVSTNLLFSSEYKSTDFNGKKIGLGNGWKLDLHQYVFPYLQSYNIDGFNVGNYVYIDGSFNIHKFVQYKSISSNDEATNVYYDNSGTGLKLIVKNNTDIKIVDQYNNSYIFDEEGKMIEIISSINENIKKKIVYRNDKILSVYDDRKPFKAICFVYNEDNTLRKVYSTVNKVGFSLNYDNEKLDKINKYCLSNSKEVIKLMYNESEKLEYIVNPEDLFALKISYNTLYSVDKVSSGVMRKQENSTEISSESVSKNEVYLDDDGYVSKNGKISTGYNLVMPQEYIKHETNISYYEGYTSLTNEKGININYYFDINGTVLSVLENKEGNLFTLSRTNGFMLSSNGLLSQKFNGQNIIELDSTNQYTYEITTTLLQSFKNIFVDLNEDGKREEQYSEHFNVSFWMKFHNNNVSNLKAKLIYKLDLEDHISIVRIENAKVDAWQKVVIPVNLGINQDTLSSINLIFEGCSQDTKIHIAELKITKSSPLDIYIYDDALGRELKLELETSLYYYKNSVKYNVTTSPTFYMTQNDLFLTYKSLFNSRENNETSFDLVYNNGTMIKSVESVGVTKNNVSIPFDIKEDGTPNYYFKSIDLINNNKWFTMKKQMRFCFDETTQKYYYESKSIKKEVYCENEDIDLNDYENSIVIDEEGADVTCNYQYEDGTKKSTKDKNKIETKYFYDNYGNILRVTQAKENYIMEQLETDYNYLEEDESLRESPSSITNNGITISYNYKENNLLDNVIEGNKKTRYIYDSYEEKIITVEILDITNNLRKVVNNICYYPNSNIKYIKGYDNTVYGFRYNVFNELIKNYINGNLILENSNTSNANYDEEKMTIYQNEQNNSLIYECINRYNNYGNIILSLYQNTNVLYEYENDNESKYINRLSKITDGFSGDVYNFTYNDNSNEAKEVIEIENKLKLEKYSNDIIGYTFVGDNESYLCEKSEKINNENTENKFVEVTQQKMKDDNEFNVLEDYSYTTIYDECGRKSNKNGTMTEYGINNGVVVDKMITYHSNKVLLKRLTHTITSKQGNNIDTASFYNENTTYDNNGNVTVVTEGGSRYINNPENTNLREKVALASRTYNYTYDSFNRLTSEVNPVFGDLTYEYDETTGMLSKVKKDNNEIKTFTYEDGKLTKVNNNDILEEINYDSYGNITGHNDVTFSYNSRNLMTRYEYIERAQDDSYIHSYKCDYSYNYQGIRYKKKFEENITGMSILTKTVNYYLNGDIILGEDWVYPGGTDTKKLRYFYDDEGICGIRYDGYNFTLIKDTLGNVSKVMYKGKVIGEYVYDAWGNCVVNELSAANDRERFVLNHNPFRYKGYYYDEETKLYYCISKFCKSSSLWRNS